MFRKCAVCHAVGENAKNKMGPELNELIGRTAGGLDGFNYSKAMKQAGENGLVWNSETLHQYLADPRAMVPGNKMAFPGLKKQDELDDVIAYLKTFSQGSADGSGQSGGADKTEGSDQSAAPEAAPAETTASAAEAPAADASAAGSSGTDTTSADTTAEASAAGDLPPEGAGLVYGLGREATPAEVAAWNVDIRPDGQGLPEGHGTAAEGDQLFQDNCSACHGVFGEGTGRWPVLAGGQGSLTDERPEKTIGSYWPYLSTVYDYIRRAMPFGNAHSLSNDDVYALTAYLLYLNDVVTDEDFELSKENFTSIELPNKGNFIGDDRASEAHYAEKTEPCMTDCKDSPVKITMRARILDVTPGTVDDDENQGAGSVD